MNSSIFCGYYIAWSWWHKLFAWICSFNGKSCIKLWSHENTLFVRNLQHRLRERSRVVCLQYSAVIRHMHWDRSRYLALTEQRVHAQMITFYLQRCAWFRSFALSPPFYSSSFPFPHHFYSLFNHTFVGCFALSTSTLVFLFIYLLCSLTRAPWSSFSSHTRAHTRVLGNFRFFHSSPFFRFLFSSPFFSSLFSFLLSVLLSPLSSYSEMHSKHSQMELRDVW